MKKTLSTKLVSSREGGNPSNPSQSVVAKRFKHQDEPVTKRRRSGRVFVREFSKKVPLIEQFDEIVKSAKSAARHPSGGSQPITPPRELRVKMEYLTPESVHLGLSRQNRSFDPAPSPITPPFSRPPRAILMKEDDYAPSPQEMTLSQSSSQSLHHVTQSLAIIEESPESTNQSDPLLLYAEDISLGEKSGDLDIDGLLDVFLDENSKDQKHQEELSSLSELENLNLSFNTKKSTPSNKTCNELNKGQVEGVLSLMVAVINPTAPASNLPSHVNSDSDVISETILCADDTREKIAEKSPPGAQIENTIAASPNNTSPTHNKPSTSATVLKESLLQSSMKNELPANTETPTLTVQMQSNNHEAFCEDLDLSNSQFLDIDAQCNLLQDESQKVDMSKEGTTTVEQGTQQERKLQDLGFSIPAAPNLQWMEKIVESGQRLRAVTQEVSRINAMVLRARRTLWPQQTAMSQPHLHQSSVSNENMMSQPSGTQHPPNFGLLLTSHDQDWNIS